MKRKKWIWAGIVSLLVICSTPIADAASFPIVQNFSGSQPADWELRASSTWNTTVSGDQTLRLTQAVVSQTGLGFYNDAFPSDLGIVAEFRYYTGGGTGADGFAFFLVDGDLVDENNIAAGALGGALGYAQSTITPADGIPHAYLGVGFDEFGNFVTDSGGMDPGSVSPVPDSVVLRGSGNGVVGYDYLTHRDIFDDFGQRIDGGWRIARVTVLPATTTATVRVEMSFDEGETWETIINDYVYNEVPPANLKLGFTGGTGGSTNIHAIGNLTVKLPVDLETTLTVAPSSTYERGDAFTYTYTVENHGPNDSVDTTIENSIPVGVLGINNLTWTLTSTHGSSSSGTGADIDEINVSIPEGETVTVVVTGVVGGSIINTTDLDHTISATPEVGASDPSAGDAVVTVTVATDAPTAAESALLLIIEYADPADATTMPDEDDYDDAGVTGVTSQNVADINIAVANSGAATREELQAIVDSIATVTEYGDTNGVGTTPTVSDYLRAGISGVTDSNLVRVNDALAGDSGDTFSEMKAYLIDYINRLSRGGGSATRAPATSAVMPAGTGAIAPANAKIDALIAQIAALQKRLGLSRGPTTTIWALTGVPVRDLTVGMSGEDVKALQLFLIGHRHRIEAGATGYFGTQTKAALAEYQVGAQINPAVGYFGVITRTQMKNAGLAGLWW